MNLHGYFFATQLLFALVAVFVGFRHAAILKAETPARFAPAFVSRTSRRVWLVVRGLPAVLLVPVAWLLAYWPPLGLVALAGLAGHALATIVFRMVLNWRGRFGTAYFIGTTKWYDRQVRALAEVVGAHPGHVAYFLEGAGWLLCTLAYLLLYCTP